MPWLSFLLLIATYFDGVLAQASEQHALASASAASAVQCEVQLHGQGSNITQAAGIHCTGGPIKAASDDPAVLQTFKRNSSGVAWQTTDNCGMPQGLCLLVICGTTINGNQVITIRLSVQRVLNVTQSLWGVVCITGNTRAALKGTTVKANNATGLVVTGSAHVSITNSTFADSWCSPWAGGALAVDGNASVQVTRSVFRNNGCPDEDDKTRNVTGGASLATGNAQVSLQSCNFSDNQLNYGRGGAMHLQDNVKLLATDCSFTGNVGGWGGALCTYGNADLKLDNCTFRENWSVFGGAVYAAENSTINVINSLAASNYVKDYYTQANGGAFFVNNTATLRLANVTVRNNSAGYAGGAVAVGSPEATLDLGPGTRITENTANRGGGLYIMRVLNNMTHAALVTVRNKAVISDNIGVDLAKLEMASDAVVPAFVPRLGENKGMLPVRLKLTGVGGLPGSADIQAVLDGLPVARSSSDPVTGEALLNINLEKHPGRYKLTFEVLGLSAELNTHMSVVLAQCGPGEINVTAEMACNTCPKGSYSLQHHATKCERCPAYATCDGGGIIPFRGFWSSSLLSNQIHRCLYPQACGQAHTPTELLLYQHKPLDNTTQATFMLAQCITGHEGNLCGRCSKGYGQRMSSLVSRCQPCASQGAVIAMYLFAAIASMLVIRVLCWFHSFEARATTAHGRHARKPTVAPPSAGDLEQPGAQVSVTVLDKDTVSSQDSMSIGKVQLPGATHTGSSVRGPPSAQAAAAAAADTANQVARADRSPGLQVALQPSAAPGDLLKPFIVYLQWMLVVANVNVDWPTALSGPFTALSWLFAASSTSTALDCVLNEENSTLATPIRKVLFGLLMPIALLLLLVALEIIKASVWRLLQWRQQQRLQLSRRRLRSPSIAGKEALPAGVIAQTAIVLVFFFLPQLLRTGYGLFACVQLDKSMTQEQQVDTFFKFTALGAFWLLDMNQQCFAGYHRVWAAALGVPLLVVLCGAVPFGVLAYLALQQMLLQAQQMLVGGRCNYADLCRGGHQCVWVNPGSRFPVHPPDSDLWLPLDAACNI